MSVNVRKRLFTAEEFYQMAETGILSERDRVELIDGEIVEMAAIGNRHAACLRRLVDLFGALRPEVLLDPQNPLHLSEYSEPQPDLMLLRRKDDYYAAAPPAPEDVLLVVEIANTSAAYDREVKVPLYAQGGLREVWLADLPSECVEVYRRPSPAGYGEVRRLRRGQRLSPEAFPAFEVEVTSILG